MKYCVGVLTAELYIEQSHSLKDRRSVLNSLKERIRQRFNVSIAELDTGERWQRGGFVCSAAGVSPAVVERALRDVLNFIEQDPRVMVMMPQLKFHE